MNLQDILDSLASSELANLSCVDQSQGIVRPEKIPQVITALNIGLTRLHTRFKLRRNFLKLDVTLDTNIYSLTEDQSNELYQGYVLDSADNIFIGNVIEIIEIIDSEKNRIKFDGSECIFLLKPNVLKFKYVDKIDVYTVEYSELPEPVVYSGGDNPEDILIDLPDVYLYALICFIASRFHSPVGVSLDSNRGRDSMDMNYLQRFEAECQLLTNQGIDVDTSQKSEVFEQRGFV